MTWGGLRARAVVNETVSWLPDLPCRERRQGSSGSCQLWPLLWWRLLHHPLQLHTGSPRAAHYIHLVRKRLTWENRSQPCEVLCPQKTLLVQDCVLLYQAGTEVHSGWAGSLCVPHSEAGWLNGRISASGLSLTPHTLLSRSIPQTQHLVHCSAGNTLLGEKIVQYPEEKS